MRGKIEGEDYLIEIDGEHHGYGLTESKQTQQRNDIYTDYGIRWIQIIESLCIFYNIKIEDYAVIRSHEKASKVRAIKRMIL